MRVNIYLLVLVLGFKATAGIIHEIVKKNEYVTLRCPRSVEGNVTWSRETNGHKTDILTVSGDRVIKHINDPDKRYSSLADKTLFILKAVVSDSGRYFCNNEAVKDLTVIPSGTTIVPAPERTNVTLTCPHDVGASHVPTRSRDSGGKRGRRFNVSSVNQTLTITKVRPDDSGLYYCDGKPAVYLNVIEGNKAPPTTTTTRQTSAALPPTEAKVTTVPSTPPLTGEGYITMTTTATRTNPTTLTIASTTPTTASTIQTTTTTLTIASTTPTTASTTPPTATTTLTTVTTTPTTTTLTTTTPTDTTTTKKQRKKNKNAVKKTTTTTIRTTTTTKTGNTTGKTSTNAAAPLPPWVYGVVVSFLLLLFLVIVYFTRRRFKRRGSEERGHVYDEIRGGFMLQPTNDGGTLAAQAAAHSVADVSDGSNQHEPMYDTILDLPPVKKKTVTSLPNESPYSLVGYDCNNKGLSQLADDTYCLLGNTYCLLEKPKATANNQN